MILHIVHDEKFIDAAHRVFEAVSPENNRFLVISDDNVVTYIKTTPVQFITKRELQSTSFINSLNQYEMVVLHFLDYYKLLLVARASENVKFVWLGWGADYYDIIAGDPRNLLKPLTQNLYNASESLNLKVIRAIKQVVKKILYRPISKAEVADKISFFAPVLFEDYQLIKAKLPNFKPKYLSWNYGTLEDDMIKGFEDVFVSGDNILVGNSASYPNNHLDVFELLKIIPLAGKKIYCPLSYGDSALKEKITTNGKILYGEHFIPVIDFMPIEQYVQLISSCSIVIMNHLRQQALGNIIIMMHLGAKVFLDKHNPVYQFFKKEGAFIYEIDELASEYLTRLDKDSISHNRTILKKHWSRDVILTKTKNLIETVCGYGA